MPVIRMADGMPVKAIQVVHSSVVVSITQTNGILLASLAMAMVVHGPKSLVYTHE